MIIADPHNHVDMLERTIANEIFDEVIFMGDYFDYWYDGPPDAEKTAKWLKNSLEQPNRIHLWGNHDMPYAFSPRVSWLNCPGWTVNKSLRVNKILHKEDWDKLKLAYIADGFVFSHAGISLKYFAHPLQGISFDSILARCDKAMKNVEMDIYDDIFKVGMGRGGYGVGGIIWADWRTEFEPIEGINQVVGHTPCKRISDMVFIRGNSINYNFDTNLKYYGILEDGKMSIVENKIWKKYDN